MSDTLVQQVPLGHLLALISRYPICTTRELGMIALFRYLAQYPLVGPALNAFAPAARIAVARQHSWLLKVKLFHPQLLVDRDWPAIWAWLDRAEDALGATHPLSPATDEDWSMVGATRAPRALKTDGTRWSFAFQDPDPATWLLTRG